MLGPNIPGLVTVTTGAQQANVVVDVEYVTLGDPLDRDKAKATAVTQAALDAVRFG